MSKLSILYTNANQLKNKMNELNIRINDNMPNIIGITEVKNKNKQQNIKLAEYSLHATEKCNIISKSIENNTGR